MASSFKIPIAYFVCLFAITQFAGAQTADAGMEQGVHGTPRPGTSRGTTTESGSILPMPHMPINTPDPARATRILLSKGMEPDGPGDLPRSVRVLREAGKGLQSDPVSGLPFPMVHFDPGRFTKIPDVSLTPGVALLPTVTASPAIAAIITTPSPSKQPIQTSIPTATIPPTPTPIPVIIHASPQPLVSAINKTPVPTRAPTIAPATKTPQATTRTPSPRIGVVQEPVPLNRSSAPAMANRTSIPNSPRPTPSPIANIKTIAPQPSPTATRTEPVDPHALPEYRLVQLPARSGPPAPVESLPTTTQELTGTQGQSINLRLPGRGWIYTGTGKTPAGVSYLEKTVQPDAEQFRFRLDETGRLQLQFQRQDLTSGLLERQEVTLAVSPRASSGPATIVSTPRPSNDISQYQPQYPVPQEKNGANNTRVGPAGTTNNGSQTFNITPTSVPSGVNPDDTKIPTDAIGILALAIRRDQGAQASLAQELYERILKDFPSFDRTDETMFRLARLLETRNDARNIRRAFELYVRIQNEWPYSSYVDQAKERARYLNRTFFRP